jgi:hypothetical protein
MRLGVGFVLVRTGVVGDYGGVELLREFALGAGDGGDAGALDFAGEGLVVDGLDHLADLVLEVLDEGVELGFELAGAGLLLGAAFGFEALAVAGEGGFAGVEGVALGGGGGELVVQLFEEGAEVGGLGGELGARVIDDVRVET